MNIEYKNLKDNEWAIINDEGKMRIVKTDAESTEMADILNKEDELESLQRHKYINLKDIEKLNHSFKKNKKLSLLTLGCMPITIGILFLINHGFSTSMIPSLVTGIGSLGILESIILIKNNSDKKVMKICKESLQKINEKKPELEKEIEKLKERHNFKEEVKELNYLGYLKYTNNQDNVLVRKKIKK